MNGTIPTAKIRVRLHPGQRQVHDTEARFKVLAAGRRWGKTRLGVNECLNVAINGGRAWWVSPTYKTGNVGWRPIKAMASKIPYAQIFKVEKMVLLPSGGSVSIRSADNPDALRGEGLNLAVMDEFAYMRREAWTEAIRPALSDRQGHALFISTPNGRNHFWELYQNGVRGEPGWASFTFPTGSNPFIHPDEIVAAKNDLPELIFRQEYLAEFIDDGGGVFRRVQEAAVLTPSDPLPNHQYIAGVDVAASVDFTVVTVMDCATNEMVYMDRFNRVDYPVLIDRLEAVHNRYKLMNMIVETNSIGQVVVDIMVERGLNIIPFTTNLASKQSVIRALQSAFENGSIRVLDDPVLTGELLSFESKRSSSGSFSYSAPDGMHDDCVMSLAFAWYGLTDSNQWSVY